MNPLIRQPSGRHFLQIPGPTNVPDRVLRAIDAPTIDHRGPEFARAGQDGPRRHEEGVQDRRRGRHLSGVGNRRVGSGARQHAVAGRSRADGRDRPLRHAVEQARRSAWALPSNSCPATGATASRPRPIEAQARRGSRSTRSRRCASCTTRRRPASRAAIADVRAGDRSRRPSGALHGRHDLVARVDRLPPRRMGRRRHRRRLAERADAAAGTVVQRDQRTRRSPPAKTAKLPRSYWDWDEMLAINPSGFFPYTPATNLLYGLPRRSTMLFAEGLDHGVRAARSAGRGDAPRGRRVGARDPVRAIRRCTAPR